MRVTQISRLAYVFVKWQKDRLEIANNQSIRLKDLNDMFGLKRSKPVSYPDGSTGPQLVRIRLYKFRNRR